MSRGNPSITSIFPIFTWKKCLLCGRKVSREPLWQIEVAPKDRTFICKVCKPTMYDIVQHWKQNSHLGQRLSQGKTQIITK